jgi:hypothetical protein
MRKKLNVFRSDIWDSSTDEEKEWLYALDRALSSLENYAFQFSAAVELFNFSRSLWNQESGAMEALHEDVSRHQKKLTDDMFASSDFQGGFDRESSKRHFEQLSFLRQVDEFNRSRIDRKMKNFDKWTHFAGVQAVFSVFHFYDCILIIEKVKGYSDKAKNLFKFEDFFLLKQEFEKQFPAPKLIRHSIAHEAEFTIDPDAFEKHSIKGGVETDSMKSAAQKTMIMGVFENDTFVCTYKGKVFRRPVNQSEARQLEQFANWFYQLVL